MYEEHITHGTADVPELRLNTAADLFKLAKDQASVGAAKAEGI